MSVVNSTHFIFDVDGCITPKNQSINYELYQIISRLSSKQKVSIVTGSELSSSIQQIGGELVKKLFMSFNCMGNVIYQHGKLIKQNFWYPEQKLINYLWNSICTSKFPYRTAKHFDLRTGSMNVSIIGRNADPDQRKEYLEYDLKTNERLLLAQKLSIEFQDIEVSIGGNVSIDIHPTGKNKAQILNYIPKTDFVFLGDGYKEWGNDKPLFDAAKNINRATLYKVDDWQQTMQILQENYSSYF